MSKQPFARDAIVIKIHAQLLNENNEPNASHTPSHDTDSEKKHTDLSCTDACDLSKFMAYAYSSGGKFLTSAPLSEKGKGTLKFFLSAVKEPRSIRILVGPRIMDKEVSISEIMRRNAEESSVRLEPGHLSKEIIVNILPDKILCWLSGLCLVQGTVLKTTSSGGISMDLPVLNAIVEIYEVDTIPILISLADDLIEKLRDIVLNPPKHVPPIPDPDPKFPPPFGGIKIEPVVFSKSSSSSEMNIAMHAAKRTSSETTTMKDMSGSMDILTTKALTTNTAMFRQALIDHSILIKPILCLFPWWPVKMDLIGTAMTDECGKFSKLIFLGCHNLDVPDLYFKVKQKIIPYFPPFIIYEPKPVRCHTYWNYQCGIQKVVLKVTSPLAITCPPCPPIIAPNNWVLFMAIGNLAVSRIHGASIPLVSSTTTDNLGLTDWDAPFGELLRPRIEFDNSLREDLGVKYYRVSYRKGTTGDSFR